MLTLTRREGQSILIFPKGDLPPDMTVAELFADGPIEILCYTIEHREGRRHPVAKLGIESPAQLRILRSELLHNDGSEGASHGQQKA